MNGNDIQCTQCKFYAIKIAIDRQIYLIKKKFTSEQPKRWSRNCKKKTHLYHTRLCVRVVGKSIWPLDNNLYKHWTTRIILDTKKSNENFYRITITNRKKTTNFVLHFKPQPAARFCTIVQISIFQLNFIFIHSIQFNDRQLILWMHLHRN